MGVLYICDRKQCDNCSFPECQLTSDISHAINFIKAGFPNEDGDVLYVENSIPWIDQSFYSNESDPYIKIAFKEGDDIVES